MSGVTVNADASRALRAHPATIKGFGHSMMEGVVGVQQRRNRFSTRLCGLLACNEENYGYPSKFFCTGADDITARVLQLVNPTVASGQGSSTVTRSAAGEFQAANQVAIIWGGANDAGVQACVNSGYTGITEGLRSCICRLQAEAKFEDDHASMVFAQGGGASNWFTGSITLGSGTSGKADQAVGNLVTITVPSYFPGGEIDIGGVVPAGNATTFSVTLDGVTQTAWNTSNVSGMTNENRVYRLTGWRRGRTRSS
jgi:hypothetical protein